MKQKKESNTADYFKQGKVSIWVSQFPYGEIPDAYFEEQFTHKKSRAVNTWSENFKLPYFKPDFLETNGVYKGTTPIKKAAGFCSFSSSYVEAITIVAKEKKMDDISWIVLLYDQAYNPELSGIEKDQYLTFLGVFDYDENADSLYKPAH